jgi:hypothetical protein
MTADRAWVRLGSGRRLNPQRSRTHLLFNRLTNSFVSVQPLGASQQHLEGVIVDGECNDEGQWLLDGTFTVFTVEEELIRVSGRGCHVEIQ